MPTDISVQTTGSYTVASRAWLRGMHGTDPGSMPSIPLNLATFIGPNFTDGTIKAGCLIGKTTASGIFGVYDPAATDGRQTAVGFLWNTITIGTDTARKLSDALFVHGFVNDTLPAAAGGLPYTTGLGALDAAARTALANRIYFI